VYTGIDGQTCEGNLFVRHCHGPQLAFDQAVLSPGDAAEIAMRKDFPEETKKMPPDKGTKVKERQLM
jgi:hypothetical protein